LGRIAQADLSATESPTCSVAFSPNSEAVCEIGARGRPPRIRGHCSSAAPVAYIEPEWTLVPGPFLRVMANSGCFAAAGTATAVMAPGRTKSAVGGHQSVQGTVIDLPHTKAESAEGWPAKRGKKHVECRTRPGVSSQRGGHRGWADRG